MSIEIIAIGASSGGVETVLEILTPLPNGFRTPIIVVQHIRDSSETGRCALYEKIIGIPVKEIEQYQPIQHNAIYLAPGNYHCYVENDRTFSLSVDQKENYSRPSIDVLFESVSKVFGASALGVLLTGANHDGAKGLGSIRARGGLAIVQDPSEAKFAAMPQEAIRADNVDYIYRCKRISEYLISINESPSITDQELHTE